MSISGIDVCIGGNDRRVRRSLRILGIDPGLRQLGWGVVDATPNALSYVSSGALAPPGELDMGPRLGRLAAGLRTVLQTYRPTFAAIEMTFVNKNAKSSLLLGQARGVALVVVHEGGLPIAEYAPNAVKKSICGRGHGTKDQVAAMVRHLLPAASSVHGSDVFDALAVAICHSHWHFATRVSEPRKSRGRKRSRRADAPGGWEHRSRHPPAKIGTTS